MKKVILGLIVLGLTSLSHADTMELDTNNLLGNIVIHAALSNSAKLTLTSDIFVVDPLAKTIADVDLGSIDPVDTAAICTNILANSTGNTGDWSAANCQVSGGSDLYLNHAMVGLVQVGGSNTVDLAYTPVNGDFEVVSVCASVPALDGAACAVPALTGLVHNDTFTHHLKLGMPLNAGSSTPIPATNIFTGQVGVQITIN